MKRLACVVLVLALGSLVFAQQAADWYIGKPIKDIRFEGLVVVPQKDVDPVIKEFMGQTFSDMLWTNLLARVYALDFFETVMPEAVPADGSYSAVIVLFKVKEKPSVEKIMVEGNVGIRTQEIISDLATKVSTIFNAAKTRLDEVAIRRKYLEKGYPDVLVSSAHSTLENGNVAVVFKVNEGSRLIVESISFEGINAISATTLKGEMTLKEKNFFRAGQYTEALFSESKEAILKAYKKRGYIDAIISDVRRDAKPDPKNAETQKLDFTFVISEGKQYRFGALTFSGNTLYPDEDLSSSLRLKQGDILNYERIQQAQGKISDKYYDQGYIFNTFTLNESRDADAGTVSYTLVIKELPQAKVESITFKGNVKTKDHVMRRLVELKPGDVFSKAKLIETMKNFYNTQFFSAVVPEYDRGSDDLLVALTFTVTEQSTASIQAGASYTPGTVDDSFPITALLNWTDINFLGNGQSFGVKTNLALTSQDVTVSFSDDWILGKRFSAGIDFSFKHMKMSAAQDSAGPIFSYNDPTRVPDPYESYEEYLAAGKVVPEIFKMKYDTWTFSLGYSAGYRIPTVAGMIGFGVGIMHELEMKTYPNTTYRPFDEGITRNHKRWLFTNSIFFRMYLNNLDLWYNPSLGYYMSQKLSLTGWFNAEANHFMRSDTRIEGYVTLFDIPATDSWSFKAILGAFSKFSVMFKQPGRAKMDITPNYMLAIDGFFVGRGWSSIYGYSGTMLWDNWIELRLPVLPSIFSIDTFLSGAIIGDERGVLNVSDLSRGVVSYDKKLSMGSFALSFGFGLRFLILQFPFRLYIARQFVYDTGGGFKLTKTPWQFVFSVTTNLD